MAQTDSNRGKHAKNQPAHPAASPQAGMDSPSIGFNELRQACEISALREDLARLSDDADALCSHIEDAVELVRDRVAGLCAEELADPDVMAPLLQFAVGTLIGIRDRARDMDTRTGVKEDAARPDWTAGASPRSEPKPEQRPEPRAFPAAPPPPSPSPPSPSPIAPAALIEPATPKPARIEPAPLSPIRSAFSPAPAAARPAATGSSAYVPPPVAPATPSPIHIAPRRPAPANPGAVDWLSPAQGRPRR